MSRSMWLAGLAVVALLAVGYLLARHGGDDDGAADGETAQPKTAEAEHGPAVGNGPARRLNPVVPPPREPELGGAGKLAAGPFADEPTDDAWADAKVAEIRQHLGLLEDRMPKGARVAAIECRTTRCQLDVAGDKKAAGAVLELLQSEEGFHGSARSLYVRTPPDSADPDLQLLLELRFR